MEDKYNSVDKVAKIIHTNFQKIKEHLVRATPEKLTMGYTISARARIVKPVEEKPNDKNQSDKK